MPRYGMAIVRGRSMLPTLRDGDRLLVRYGGAPPRPGALALVRLPARPLSVKRVTARTDEGWWVERDNPSEGVDSSTVGAIPERDLLAVVSWRLWPRPRRLRGG